MNLLWFLKLYFVFGGVNIAWNGRQRHLEVTVPGTYKRRTCGLCGNFNNYPQDDTRLHNSRLTSSDAEFGNDWKVKILMTKLA